MIDIFSTSNPKARIANSTIFIDCNEIEDIPPLSSLRQYDGIHASVLAHFKANPNFRDLVNTSVKHIHKSSIPSFTFFSLEGLYRAPATAYVVSKELSALGDEIILTHIELPIPSEHMRPTKRTWGAYDEFQ